MIRVRSTPQLMFNIINRKLKSVIADKKFSEIFTGSVWSLGASVLSTGFSMITSIIVARFYGADIMGVVAMLTSFISLTTIFTILGTNTSILRLIPEHMVKYSPTSAFRVFRKTQYFVVVVSSVTGGALFLSSDLISKIIFSKPHLSFLFALASVFVVFLSVMDLNTQTLRGLRLIRIFALMQLLPAVCKFLILIIITLFLYNQYNPVYSQFAAYVLTALIGFGVVMVEFKRRMKPVDIVLDMPMKDIMALSVPMLMTSTMAFAIGQTGVLLLGVFRSEAEVGYYSMAVRLATLTTFVLYAINTMAAPKFSELYHSGNNDELFYVAQKSAKLIFWATLPILLGLIIFGKLILILLFGSEFAVAYKSMVILLVGQFINAISGSTGYFLNMTGRQNVFRNIMLAAAIITFGFSFALIPSFGIVGAAVSGMVSLAFWNVVALLYIKKHYGIFIGYLPCIRIK